MKVFLLILAILPLLFLSLILLINYKRLDKLLVAVLFATFLHELLLVSFPIFYSIVTDFEHETNLNITVAIKDLVNVMIGETIYVFSFCMTLFIGLSIRKRWVFKENNKIVTPIFVNTTEKKLFVFLIIVGGVTFFLQLVGMGISISNPVLAQLDAWSSGIFFSFTPLVASAILVTKKDSIKYHPNLFKMASICLVSLLVLGVLTASRGRIMWVASLVLIMGFVNNNKKIIYISLISLILFLPLFSFLGNFKSLAATSMISGGNSLDLFKIIYEERNTVAEVSQNNSFFYNFAERAQGPRNSIVLYDLYDQGDGAKASIYLGSIFFPAPRLVLPDKPIPGSFNEDENNSAVFKVMSIAHDVPYMGPMLASSHAYWEGGYLAVFIYGILTAFLWLVAFLLGVKLPYNLFAIVVLSFSAALLIDGFLTMFSPIYAYILILWKWIIPTIFLYLILSPLKKAGKYTIQ